MGCDMDPEQYNRIVGKSGMPTGYRERIHIPRTDAYTDWQGKEILEGDTILYAVKDSTTVRMVMAKVIKKYLADTQKRLVVQPIQEIGYGSVYDVSRMPQRNISLLYVTKLNG